MGPHPGQIIRLQFETDEVLVELLLAEPRPEGHHLLHDAEERLDVVPHFVGDHVRHGKVTRSLESLLQLVIETQVDVDLVVARAIEGPVAAPESPHADWTLPE